MKRKYNFLCHYSLLLALVCSFTMAKGQPGFSWSNIGANGFSAGTADYASIAISKIDSTIYVAYKDIANGNKLTVMKSTGSAWTVVGTAGISSGAADHISIATLNNNPYVAFKDWALGGKLSVVRWNGTTWAYEGGAGTLSAGSIADASITMGGFSDTVYVAYVDETLGNKVFVKKKGGLAAAFTDITGGSGVSAGAANYIKIATGFDTKPYLVYSDATVSNKATVQYYNGSVWSVLGSAGISTAAASFCDLAIDMADDPYIVYKDANASNKATVRKFANNTWSTVGTAGFSAAAADFTSIDIDADNLPVVVYKDAGNSDKATVRRFNGTTWVAYGAAGISAGLAEFTGIASVGGYGPFVVYKDGGVSGKVAVKGLGCTNATVPVITPGNPSFCAGTPVLLSTTAQTNTSFKWYQLPDSTQIDSLGTKTISGGGGVIQTAIQFDKNGIPYSAFISGLTLYVKRFVAGTWQDAGTNPVTTNVSEMDLAIHPDGTPYLAYRLNETAGRLYIVKLIGSTWTNIVAAAAFAPATYPKIDINKAGVLYVLFNRFVGSDQVMSLGRFNGTNFDNLNREWSSTTPQALDYDLAFDNEGKPVISYTNNDNNRLYVETLLRPAVFDLGGFWGRVLPNANTAAFSRIAVNKQNEVFVAYKNISDGGKLQVMKRQGISGSESGAWTVLGTAAVSAGAVNVFDMAFDQENNLYVAYGDGGLLNQAQLKKWNGTAWVQAGVPNFSVGSAANVRLDFDNNNVPHVLYTDASLGNKATLLIPEKKYLSNATVRPVNIAGDYFITAIAGCQSNVSSAIVAVNQSSPTNNWTGAVSTAWQTAGNWSCGNIPGENDNVVIPAAVPRMPVIGAGLGISIGTLLISNNATVTVSGTASLTIKRDLKVNGSLQAQPGSNIQVTNNQ